MTGPRPDRISARYPRAWSDYVKLRHRMDWDRLERLERDHDLVSVVVPCSERPEVLLEQLRTVQRGARGPALGGGRRRRRRRVVGPPGCLRRS